MRTSSFDEAFPALCALRTPKKPNSFLSPNSFRALADDDSSSNVPEPVLNELNNWATKVKKAGSRPPKPSPQPISFKICSEKNLDLFLQRNPEVAAIPAAVDKLKRILREMPTELGCKDGEVLCLVKSGASINAAWIDRHFPSYSHLV